MILVSGCPGHAFRYDVHGLLCLVFYLLSSLGFPCDRGLKQSTPRRILWPMPSLPSRSWTLYSRLQTISNWGREPMRVCDRASLCCLSILSQPSTFLILLVSLQLISSSSASSVFPSIFSFVFLSSPYLLPPAISLVHAVNSYQDFESWHFRVRCHGRRHWASRDPSSPASPCRR